MEDRAVSLNAVIKAIRHTEVNFSVRSEIDFTRHKREVQEIIDNVLDAQEKALSELPSVTPERLKGHWKGYTHSAYHGVDEYKEPIWKPVNVYHCSECNRRTVIKDNFCPSCGADMRGDDDGR